MNNLIIRNAYLLLGLDISSTQKDIIKRSKEIITRLKIDDVPQYDLDLDVLQNIRNETDIKKAQQDLSEPRKRVLNYFFWFEIQDDIDEKAIGFIKTKDYTNAIKIWRINLQTNTLKSNIYKKNLCILYCLLLLTDTNQNDTYIKDSIVLWKSLVDTDRFWSAFYKVYKLNDDIDTSSTILEELPKKVVDALSDIYTDIEKRYKNSLVLAEFSRTFKIKGAKLENEVLNPIYEEIASHIELLNKIKITKEIPFELNTYVDIKSEIARLQENFNQLQKLGYYDDSQTKKLRDNAASSIRRIVLDLYNYHGEHQKAEELLKIGKQISGTEGQEYIFNEDLKILEKNKKQNEISDKLAKYINEETFNEALKYIETEELHTSNKELKNYLLEQKKAVYVSIFAKKHSKALELFNKNKLNEAKAVYEELIALIWSDIGIFNINKETLSNILAGINTKLSGLTPTNFAQIDAHRDEVVKNIENNLGDTYETIVIRFFIDSNIHAGSIPIIQRFKRAKTRNNLIGWIVFIGFFIIVGAFNNSHNTNQSTNTNANTDSNSSSADDCSNVSPGQYCCSPANSAQADTLKPDSSVETQLQSEYTKLNNEQANLDSNDQSAVDTYNTEVDQYNKDKNDYNSKNDQYNKFLAQNCTLK